ncbi:MAG TPA: hypothetical protein VJ183_08395 [Chloroflexia bacterium]|nr:hypothetical protein [Chloroflexia bacterium]
MDTMQKTQKRYNLVLPTEVFEEIEAAAEIRHVTVADLLRDFIKLGLLAIKIEETPGSTIVFREGNTDTQVKILSFMRS